MQGQVITSTDTVGYNYLSLALTPASGTQVLKWYTSWRFAFKSIRGGFVKPFHYNDVIMSTIASQITSLTIVYLTVYSGAYQRKHQSSASLAFVRGIHRGPVNSPHKGPVTRKMFPFDDVIMENMWVNSGSNSAVEGWILDGWHPLYRMVP